MKRKFISTLFALVLVLTLGLVTAVPAEAQDSVPDRVTAITTTADRLVDLQSTTDYGWDWIVTELSAHSANPSAYNMYGVVILGLLDAYEITNTESYLAAATGMADHMTSGEASNGDFYKQGGDQEPAGAYDYQFLMQYAEVSDDPAYSDYAIALWDWNKANTPIFASPSALNDELLGWAGSDPGAAAWQLAAFGEASRLMGDGEFATGCADLIVADLAEDGEGWLVGDHMAEAECLEFLNELDSATYSSTIGGIITDLVEAQQADGCWNDGFAGTFQDTAYAVRALAVHGGTDGLDAARKGAAWLVANQLDNGGWIDDSGDTSEEYSEQDAEGLRALIATAAPVTIGEMGYYSIQSAIDSASPGDTINVAAGIYDLTAPIVVDESVTLTGDVSTPGNVVVNAPITSGLYDRDCFQVKADNVTIQGFRIVGAMDDKADHHPAWGQPGRQNAGIMVGNDLARTLMDDSTAYLGISGGNFSYNEFVDCSKGLYLYHATNSEVSYNTITTTEGQDPDNFYDTLGWNGDGVHIYLEVTSDYPTGNIISYNTMDNVRVGIFLNGDTIAETGPTGWDFRGTTIEANTMTNVWNAGIILQCASGTVESPIIININDINTSTGRRGGDEGNERGLISVHGDYTVITGNNLTNSEEHGLWVDGSHRTVTGNTVTSNPLDGIHVGWYKETEPVNGWTLPEITRADISVSNNTLQTNTVQVGDPTEALDIQSVFDNNFFDRAVVVDHTGTSLLHTIWSSIQDGINAASSDDTVKVAAGTYTEYILIDRPLTVRSTDEAEETIIDGIGFRYMVMIYSANVTFEGFTVTNPTYEGGSDATGILIGAYLGQAVENVHIFNNIVKTVRSESGTPSMYGATGINIGRGPLSNVVISGNTIKNIHNPEGASIDHTCGINVWDGADGVVISNNTISDIKYNGILLQYASNVQIENNNTITECETGIRVEPFEGATVSGLTVNLNNFADNSIQVLDDFEVLDIGQVLETNTFDHAVVVDHLGSLLHTIWSSIQDGINAASSDDTVLVAAGAYSEHIVITTSSLNLIGEDKETTIIDATQDSSWPVAKPGILIGEYPLTDGVHRVTVSGFTIKDAAMQEGDMPYEGGKYDVGPGGLAGIQIYNSSSNIIEDNILINNYWQIWLVAEWPAAGYTECKNNRIANNIIMDSEQDGVYLYSDGGVYVENTEIVSNEISNVYGEQASGVEFWGWAEGGDTPTISGTVVEGNLVTGCTYGVRIRDDVSDITGTSVKYNDFVDNTNYGIYNGVASTIDATGNWWGHASGPGCELSNGKWVGKGDKVSDNVNYKPWLHKSKEKIVPTKKPAYAQSVVLDNTGDYGWNTFSAPIFLDAEADIWEELYGLAELDYSVAYRFDSDIQEFVPLTTTDDYAISPGEGFFIKMNDVGCLTILYSTEENLTPPSRPLTAGWNLIGLANLEDMNVDDAFASIASAPDLAGYSQVISPTGNTKPGPVLTDGTIYVGESYWVYMLGARTLAGFTMTPVEWVP